MVCKVTERAALFASFQLTVMETVFMLLAGELLVTDADWEKKTPPSETVGGTLLESVTYVFTAV